MFSNIRGELVNYADGALHIFDAEKNRNPKTRAYGESVKLGGFIITCVAITAIGLWMFNARNAPGVYGFVCSTGYKIALSVLVFAVYAYITWNWLVPPDKDACIEDDSNPSKKGPQDLIEASKKAEDAKKKDEKRLDESANQDIESESSDDESADSEDEDNRIE